MPNKQLCSEVVNGVLIIAVGVTSNILQRNCQGLTVKKSEVCELMEACKPCVMTVQETKLRGDTVVNIPSYSWVGKHGHYNVTPHGGVGICIHQSIPTEQVTVNTEHQSIAVRGQLNRMMTICSLYVSRSHELTEQSLQHLIDQLPTPVILTGDFNAYNTMWGSEVTDSRGQLLKMSWRRMD